MVLLLLVKKNTTITTHQFLPNAQFPKEALKKMHVKTYSR